MFINLEKLRYFSPMVSKSTLAVSMCVVLSFFSFSSELFSSVSESFSSEIEWKLFLSSSNSKSIITTATSPGEAFIIDYEDISGNISGSKELLKALDGTSFLIQQSPVSGPLTIHIILNVQGNRFESANGKNVCLNLNIDAYVNGTRENGRDLFRNSPLVMTIPKGNGLSYLLELSNCNRSDILFVYYPGGNFENDGIETHSRTSELVVNIIHGSTIVAGVNSELGFPASVNNSTWYKIKKLFE